MNYTIAQTLSNQQFKHRFGIQSETFKAMIKVLKPEWRAAPKPKLNLEDRVLVALEYWREYRTYFHIGATAMRVWVMAKIVARPCSFDDCSSYSSTKQLGYSRRPKRHNRSSKCTLTVHWICKLRAWSEVFGKPKFQAICQSGIAKQKYLRCVDRTPDESATSRHQAGRSTKFQLPHRHFPTVLNQWHPDTNLSDHQSRQNVDSIVNSTRKNNVKLRNQQKLAASIVGVIYNSWRVWAFMGDRNTDSAELNSTIAPFITKMRSFKNRTMLRSCGIGGFDRINGFLNSR